MWKENSFQGPKPVCRLGGRRVLWIPHSCFANSWTRAWGPRSPVVEKSHLCFTSPYRPVQSTPRLFLVSSVHGFHPKLPLKLARPFLSSDSSENGVLRMPLLSHPCLSRFTRAYSWVRRQLASRDHQAPDSLSFILCKPCALAPNRA